MSGFRKGNLPAGFPWQSVRNLPSPLMFGNAGLAETADGRKLKQTSDGNGQMTPTNPTRPDSDRGLRLRSEPISLSDR
jgi:hypothetical protein